MRLLVLTTDAFGGHGGIAKYNSDLLTALCSHPGVDEVVAIPRIVPGPVGRLPSKLRYEVDGLGGKLRYARAVLRRLAKRGRFDAVICGHINLLPFAYAAARRHGVPLILFIYGIDAWKRHTRVGGHLVSRCDMIVSISVTTLERFLSWSHVPASRCRVLPNAFDAGEFGVRPKPEALLTRYGLRGRRVLMTFGRMPGAERYKGFDEMLRLLTRLASQVPNVSYLLAGDGDDRPRLEALARSLGVADRVVFTGRIDEAEKADHYRLADVYVMPGRGEGFGFVLLEAMACGIPSIASKLDGSREAVRDGLIGAVVDPDDADAVIAAILAALEKPRHVPDGLDYFSFANFERRTHAIVDETFRAARARSA